MREDLLKIINYYGVNNQQRKLAEEVFELQEAITQYEESRRYRDTSHIAEEIADVLNLVEQFMYYYNIDFNKQVLEIKHLKVIRQLERIKNNNKELRTELNYYKCSSNRLFGENKRLKDKLNESEKARKEAIDYINGAYEMSIYTKAVSLEEDNIQDLLEILERVDKNDR